MDNTAHRFLLLAITHYKNNPEIIRFLDHVAQLTVPKGWSLEIAIADNSGTLKLPERSSHNVMVSEYRENLGYLKGCSYAIQSWIDQHQSYPEWITVANTDIEFEKSFFADLVQVSLPEGVCVLAPDIITKKGLHQNPHKRYRPSRLEIYAYTLIFHSLFLTAFFENLQNVIRRLSQWKPSFRSGAKQRENVDYEIIYSAHGSCFLLHRTYLEREGTLNFKGFMYGEEIYVAEQARRLNIKIAWVPSLKLVHDRKKTTGIVKTSQKKQWRQESAKILWDDYFSKG